MFLPKKKSEHSAWLVIYIDGTSNPPGICEAGIFAEQRPQKADRHRGFSQTILLQVGGESFEQAKDSIKEILAGPEWRWIYSVPVLTAGFVHDWGEQPAGSRPGGRRSNRCGVQEANDAARRVLGPDVDRCLVSHTSLCSGCGKRAPILAGDSLCASCRFPSH